MVTQQDKNFWLNKWVNNEIGFHLSSVNPLLKKYAPTFFESNAPVLVPLCGKTHDMVYLAELGHSVTGIELSEVATQQFFNNIYNSCSDLTNDLTANDQGNYKSYKKQNIEILVGDIFDLSQSLMQEIIYIYDRAALIALPPVIRQKYVQHLHRIIPYAKLLLITLDYPQQQFSGPPFSVTENDVRSLFSFATITQMEREDIIDKQDKFKAAGLEHFYQSVYQIVW